MGQIIFSPRSVEDLKEIYNYIKKHSPANAKKVRRVIIDECKRLLEFPDRGREIIKTPKNSIRQILVYKYRIFYRLNSQNIEIVSIYHSSRLLENNPELQRFFEE